MSKVTIDAETGEIVDRPLAVREVRLELPPRVTATPTGIEMPEDLTEREWLDVGQTLASIDHALTWWVGDWWIADSWNYGERIVDGEVAPDLGVRLSAQTLKNAGSLCRAFKRSRRRDLLSPAHHVEVQSKTEDEQDAWLDLAEANGWTVKELRAQIKIEEARLRDLAKIPAAGGTATVTKANALDWLPTIGPADLLLTDPPYATDVNDLGDFIDSWLPLALTRVKPTGRAYIFCGAYPHELHAYLDVALSIPDWTVGNILVWHYPDTLGPTPTHKYAQTWQACLYLYGAEAPPLEVPELKEQQTVQIFNMNSQIEGSRHFAWQKPDALAETLVRHGSKPGDLVIDPFAGAGTHLLAAARHGRHAIGCDLDPDRIANCADRGVEVV